MALNLQDKQAIVAEVNEAAKGALSAVIADSRGVTVDKMTELRKAAREAGVTMRVVRNTLLRRAVEGTDFECLQDTFVGPTLIAFSNEHPGAAARLFKDFAKANDKFEIKGAAFEGKIQDVEFLATLPTYEEAIARLMGSNEHPGAAARLFKDFAKANDKFEIKGAAFEGKIQDVEFLATLPTYEEAIARLMGTMKEAAAGKLVRTFAALRDKLQEAA